MRFSEVVLLQYLYIENNKIIKVGDEKTLGQCKYMLASCVTVPIEQNMKNVI